MTKRIALSWSGGKDSCMALHLLKKQGYEISCIITTVPKELGRTFGHGERTDFIQKQSEALGIPLHFVNCTFEDYTDAFKHDLTRLKDQLELSAIAFGDIYLEGHREWGQGVAASAGIDALYPLWSKEEDSLRLLEQFVYSGYQAVVIRVTNDYLDESWLGRSLDETFLADIKQQPVCPMGEHGEYHTFVYDGPLFLQPIEWKKGSTLVLDSSKRLEIE